jgi:hypothetical protein
MDQNVCTTAYGNTILAIQFEGRSPTPALERRKYFKVFAHHSAEVATVIAVCTFRNEAILVVDFSGSVGRCLECVLVLVRLLRNSPGQSGTS